MSDTPVYTLNIDEMFNAYIAATPKTWEHDRGMSVGASEVFSCMRQTWFKKRGKEFGYAPDEDVPESWGATRRGDLIELYHVVPALSTQTPEGVTLYYAGNDQVTWIDGRASATPDGLFDGLPKGPLRIIAGGKTVDVPDFVGPCLGLEIKSIDPRAILYEERAKHHGQSQMGLGLLREKTDFKPSHHVILYVNASFLDDMTPFVVTFNQSIYEAGKARANNIWRFNSPTDFEAEGKISGECDLCHWRGACGEAVLTEWYGTDDKDAASPEVIEACAEPVAAYLAAKDVRDAAEEAFKRSAQALKDVLLEIGKRKALSEEWSVSWSTQKGRKSVDYKRMAADHDIDTSQYETEGAGFDVLRVTPKVKNYEQ